MNIALWIIVAAVVSFLVGFFGVLYCFSKWLED
jgi:uncharacterized protein YneF (UPF0154 family)